MKLRTKILLIGSAVIVALIFYSAVSDRLPPRSAHKVARTITGLRISDSADVRHFEEEWNEFNGDGHVHIEIRLDPRNYSAVRKVAIRRGYRTVTEPTAPTTLIADRFAKRPTGLYKLEQQPPGSGYELIVLDDESHEILIYMVAS